MSDFPPKPIALSRKPLHPRAIVVTGDERVSPRERYTTRYILRAKGDTIFVEKSMDGTFPVGAAYKLEQTTITDEQVEAAAGILRPNGYDVPVETLRRALLAAAIDVHQHSDDR